MCPCPCTSTAHTSVKCQITNLFHKGTSEMSSFRKVVKNPSLKPILGRIGKKFAETIILSIIPRFCNPCTALTVPFAIAWLQLVVHHPMNSGIPFHKQTSFTAIETSEFENCFCLSCRASRIDQAPKKHAIIFINTLKDHVNMSGRCLAALINGGLGYDNKQMKKATVDAINVMISHADRGLPDFGWRITKAVQSGGLSGI